MAWTMCSRNLEALFDVDAQVIKVWMINKRIWPSKRNNNVATIYKRFLIESIHYNHPLHRLWLCRKHFRILLLIRHHFWCLCLIFLWKFWNLWVQLLLSGCCPEIHLSNVWWVFLCLYKNKVMYSFSWLDQFLWATFSHVLWGSCCFQWLIVCLWNPFLCRWVREDKTIRNSEGM